MRLLDLFSGIGGFSLAAEWVWGDELEIVGFCEIEEYTQKILSKNFPGVPIYEDITKLNGKDFKDIDLITGGFPCQDISIAGKGAGLEGERSGLWAELCRIISEVQPRYALIENVPMLSIRGGTRVIADLAEIGYDCEWQIIGADDVGAWHRRKRIWIVAYPRCDGRGNLQQRSIRRNGTRELAQGIDRNTKTVKASRPSAASEVVPNTNRTRIRASRFRINKHRKTETQRPERKIPRPQSESGRHSWWSTEPNVGRVAHGIPSRVERLKGLGNAIVPQVAALIMKRIKNETKTGR